MQKLNLVHLDHPVVGHLSRRIDAEGGFPWEATTQKLFEWTVRVKPPINTSSTDLVMLDLTKPRDPPRLELWTDSQGTISPEQVRAFSDVRTHFELMESPLADLIGNTVQAISDQYLEGFPEHTSSLQDFRRAFPFPSGEVEHSATEVTNIVKDGAVFVIFWFSTVWEIEHVMRVLTHRDRILALDYDSWEPHEMFAAADKL
jgi:hypothetical protein